MADVDCTFETTLVAWRGPAPHVFAPLPQDLAEELAGDVVVLSYGWGCIRAEATIGDTTFSTSLMPRNGGYLLPIKVAVQRGEQIGVGDRVSVRLRVEPR